MPVQLRDVLRGTFGFGVFGCVIAIEEVAEQFGCALGVGLVVRLELLAGQLDQLGDERVVIREPLLALVLGALAVAGVGEVVVPFGRERLAGVEAGVGGKDAADLPVFFGDE